MIIKRLFKLLFPDPKDKRDKEFRNTKTGRKPKSALPNRVNRGQRLTAPPIDQGRIGSCVGCAGVSGLQMAYNIKENVKQYNLSEQWLYFKSEEIDNHAPQGTYIRCAMKIMHKLGVPLEEVWPYKDNFKNPGKPKVPFHSPLFKIKSYHRVKTITQVLKALADKDGFVVAAFKVYEGTMKGWQWEKKQGRNMGGHAIHLIGYDQKRQEIYFNNSWGPSWGIYGQGEMSYEYFEKNLMDCWFGRVT